MLRKQIVAATLACATLMASGHATIAQESEKKPLVPAQVAGIPFSKYVQTQGYLNSLSQTVTEFEEKFGDCSNATYDARMQIGQPQKPVVFPGRSKTVPQWIEVVRVEGCEKPYVRGVLVALLDNNVNFFPLLKGNGVSGVFAQKAVLGKLLEREKSAAKEAGCSEKDDLRVTQHDMVDKTKTAPTGAWDEVWHVKNCKGLKVVQVTFTAKDNGELPDFKLQDVIVKKN